MRATLLKGRGARVGLPVVGTEGAADDYVRAGSRWPADAAPFGRAHAPLGCLRAFGPVVGEPRCPADASPLGRFRVPLGRLRALGGYSA